jgi:ketosteroid isomerase-like protein
MPILPATLRRYFEAINRQEVAAAVGCFARDAVVEDQFGNYSGRDVIQEWLTETSKKYLPTLLVLREKLTDADVGLIVSVSGHFPGSPVQLDFHFRLRGGKITALTIE